MLRTRARVFRGSVSMNFLTEVELAADIVFWLYQDGPFKFRLGFRKILFRSIILKIMLCSLFRRFSTAVQSTDQLAALVSMYL